MLNVRTTDFEGLMVIDLEIHTDERGSFREMFQAEKMEALGLPVFRPIQTNVAFNNKAGILRGIHAEPWEKLIHVAIGEVWAAIVDLREDSATFGQYRHFTLDPSNALFVPRGFGNSYQVMIAPCTYLYLVNAHWSPEIKYPSIAWDDPDLAIEWPTVPRRARRQLSPKDLRNPTMRQVYPHMFQAK